MEKGNGENDDGYDDGVRNKSEASSSGDRRAPFLFIPYALKLCILMDHDGRCH